MGAALPAILDHCLAERAGWVAVLDGLAHLVPPIRSTRGLCSLVRLTGLHVIHDTEGTTRPTPASTCRVPPSSHKLQSLSASAELGRALVIRYLCLLGRPLGFFVPPRRGGE